MIMMDRIKQWLSPSRQTPRPVVSVDATNDEFDREELRAWQSSIELRIQRLESVVGTVRKQDS
jgi:hypothetical protein